MKQYIDPRNDEVVIWIDIDDYAVASSDKVMKTVLGSCVGIILHDPNKKMFALNHFASPAAGARICEDMYQEFKRSGCNEHGAIIIGGSQIHSGALEVGKKNLDAAKEFLRSNGIDVVKSDIGGSAGRTISVKLTNSGIEIDKRDHGDMARDRGGLGCEVDYSKKAFDTIKEMMKKYEKK